MISEKDVRRIFAEELPGVRIAYVEHALFVAVFRMNPLTQQLIEAGVYDDATLDQDLLSSAQALPLLNLVQVDLEQMLRLMSGVPRRQALAWVRWTARHERMHFELGHYEAGDGGAPAEKELAVNRHIEQNYPRLATVAQQAENLSAVFKRVLSR